MLGGAAWGIGSRGNFTVTFDDDSGVEWLVDTGTSGQTTWITPTVYGAQVMDGQGDRAGVTDQGALQVASFGGTPETGIDATGADTYVSVLKTSKRCHFMQVHCITNGAQISIDGGATNGPAIVASSQLFMGLDIPAGADIQARNSVAGSAYASLIVTVW
jgi:hypothetical protein